ncbi:class I SAM-dependent methyltransferase [Aquihabitans daechungensis]|uniref:class I SAM-dependent methyltransferase n=1 Tax=Aquihabitans daechungensis TaxID=1052257 RepID=UPI003B9DE4FC
MTGSPGPAPVDAGHWTNLAAHWDAIGPPLRPTATDVDAVVQLAEALPRTQRRCLVLGATKELAEAPWPAGCEVRAVDRSPTMLDALWTGAGTALLGDWRSLPLGTASTDLVMCDGGWHLLDRTDQERLANEVARVLRPGALLAVRLFAPPIEALDTAGVIDLLDAGAITDANHLKVLLWMAERDRAGTVAVADVWSSLIAAHPDLEVLADRRGWPPATLRAFEVYRGSTDRYHLLDRDELARQLDATSAFEPTMVIAGAPFGPGLRFPTVVHRRTA